MKMFEDLMKMKGKPSEKDTDSKAKGSKMGLLKEISDMASKAMGDDIKGIKKVTIASNNEQGLEEGLSKAKDMIGGESEEEPTENPVEEALDACKSLSSDEIDSLIKELEQRKSELSQQ